MNDYWDDPRTKERDAMLVSQSREIERLRAALKRYGRHDWSGMPDEPELRCKATRMGGGPCTCGLDAALAGEAK